MIKYFKILIFIIPVQLFAQILAPDISFIDLPLNAKTGSLGNTYLSDIGCPSNIMLNPANIWFGDRVNSKVDTKDATFWNNIYLRANLSNITFMQEDNVFNLIGTAQLGDKITIGLGYIENNQENINDYDSNANYIGEIKYKQSASSIGFATKLIGINIGVSGTYFNNIFENNMGAPINNNEVFLLTTGISLNDVKLRKAKQSNNNKSFIQSIFKIVPSTISFQMTSRILYYDEIANNSISKNIFGSKSTYEFENLDKSIFSILFDYHSNNDISDELINIGANYTFNPKWGSMGINAGINDFNNNNNLAYGVEFKYNKLLDVSISFSNIETSWGSTYSIFTFKYSYDKK